MSDRPDVLFVVLDSARADRVSMLGHDRETTPALSRLADEATTYENAYTPAPWTLPSHTSMFTGQLPSEHGVTNGFSDRMHRVPDDTATLAEELSAVGYRTAGFSNNPWVGQLSGLNRGFDEFVEWDLECSRSTDEDLHTRRERAYSRGHSVLGKAARQPLFLLKRRFFTTSLVDRATRWLSRSDDRPTFTFLNLMEAHSPYYPPKRAFRRLGLEVPSPIEPRILNTRLLAYVMGKSDLDPDDRRRVMEFYDASLRYQDRKFEELLDALRREGRFDDALVVVCSDHGKTLGDYDRDGRPPHYVRDINLNVPLVVKRPSQRRSRTSEAMVELTDLFDVVRRGGDSLERYERDVAVAEDFVPHAGREAPDEVTHWRIAADADYKFVESESGDSYLFDRTTDEPIRRPADDRLDPYREHLSSRFRATGDGEATESEGIDASVEAQLKDLGYM